MSRSTLQYRRLARNEARFRLKEALMEDMLESVDKQDNWHVLWMQKIKQKGWFCNMLLPSDIQEIEQAIKHRKEYLMNKVD